MDILIPHQCGWMDLVDSKNLEFDLSISDLRMKRRKLLSLKKSKTTLIYRLKFNHDEKIYCSEEFTIISRVNDNGKKEKKTQAQARIKKKIN